MTQDQKDTLRFYTTNDYLLINGLLWGEKQDVLDEMIRLINEDGRRVMQEALDAGFSVRWDCTREEGERLYRVYQQRFPVLDTEAVKQRVLDRARQDIANMKACLEPLDEDLVLYRNVKSRFVEQAKAGQTMNCLGFSSCSLQPHMAEHAMYGSGGCTLVEITVPAGAMAIRLDRMKDVQNEPDEVILGPMAFVITQVDAARGCIRMTAAAQ